MTRRTQSGLASAERVFEWLDARELSPQAAETATPPATLTPRLRGHIEFNKVSFRYRPDQALFEGVKLEALPGQTVAVVGPTGAGKTTLMNLLLRFYEVGAGCIRMDGVDIRTMSREALRSHFGVVPQGGLAVCRQHSRQHGLRPLKAGGGLSAGQQQLLTTARAFIAQRSVLILDEATSLVDTRTERLVQQAMARLRQGRTSFVIAHRLSTILDADLSANMESGDVLEQGNHTALMAARGRCWALYERRSPVPDGADLLPARKPL